MQNEHVTNIRDTKRCNDFLLLEKKSNSIQTALTVSVSENGRPQAYAATLRGAGAIYRQARRNWHAAAPCAILAA